MQRSILDIVVIANVFLSPVAYSWLACRAKQNLIDTAEWHKWAFRAYVAILIFLAFIWMTSKKEILCV